jgi:sucrose-6-phosphate hydrolase SacC (GH32 family)
MFYGDWTHICHATSRDGKTFERVADAQGQTGLFGEGADANARDPMVLRVGDLFHCYYTAFPGQKGAVFCRTSKDMAAWSEAKVVASGGSAGTGPFSHECPHVVYLPEHGLYCLFHTQRYGQDAQTSVYASKDPLNFGVDDDRFLVCRLPVAAPELVLHEGKWHIASLLPSLKGIRVARLRWASPGE